MSTARSAKIQASKAASAKKYESQTITIDKHWKIHRPDALNWEIRHNGEFYGYYGKLSHAFNDLPVKMLGEVAQNDLREVQRSLQAIHDIINTAIQNKVWEDK